MKQISLIVKCVLILTLCTINMKGWAQTVIFSEDFSWATSVGSTQTSNTWVLSSCQGAHKVLKPSSDVVGKSLKILTLGSAISPAFTNLQGNANVMMSIANGANAKSVSFTIGINSGTFEDNTTLKTFTTGTWNTSYYHNISFGIRNGTTGTKLTISWESGETLLIGSLYVYATGVLSLSDSESNATTLTDNNGKIANVTLGRTFTQGIWNTLCLPFDVTTESVKTAFGQTEDPELRVFSSVEGNSMKFTAPSGTVTAGTPFLLNLSTAPTSAITFAGVIINNTSTTAVTHGGYSFTGVYSPTVIAATNWFLKADGKLYRPGAETEGGPVNLTLAGLRAYFTIPSTNARPLISIDSDGTATNISPSTIRHPLSTESIYTLDGHQIDYPTAKGIYIVRNADGSTRKVIKN